MKASDLRIGNLYYYRVLDQLDPKKEWFEVSKIDYDDLRVIAIKDEMNQDYQPIPLNEEWLLKFGFEDKKTCFNLSKREILGHDFGDFAVSKYDDTQMKV